jgi:hypothetical protein
MMHRDRVTTLLVFALAAAACGDSPTAQTQDDVEPVADAAPAEAPDGLSATVLDSATVRLAWTDNSATETQFEVQEMAGSQTQWGVLALLPANTTSHTAVIRSATTFRVRACNDFGCSAFSNTAVASPRDGPPAATAVAGRATWWWGSMHGFAVGRVNPAGVPARAWIEWGTDPTLQSGTATAAIDVGSGLQDREIGVLLGPVTDSVRYHLRVVAENDAGITRSGIVTFLAAPPRAPGDITVEHDSAVHRVHLTWSAVPHAELYRVSRRALGDSVWTVAGTHTQNTFADLPPLRETHTYEYAVSSCFVSTACGTPSPAHGRVFIPRLAPPTNLQVTTPSAGSVVLRWTDNSDNETRFRITRRVVTTGAPVSFYVDANVTNFEDSTATPGTAYYYLVEAVYSPEPFNTRFSLPSNVVEVVPR